jgi:putative Mn2+ efflux pump MntP
MASAFLCSIDSFLASLGIGLFGCCESSRRKLVLAFAVFDFSATLAGTCFQSILAGNSRGRLSLSLMAIVVMAVAVAVVIYNRRVSALFLWVPVLLSLDNFIAGLLDGSRHVPQFPLVAGFASGVAAWAGFAVARGAGMFFPRRIAVIVSVSLLMLAFVLTN